MNLVISVILLSGIFNVALSQGLGQILTDWWDAIFGDSEESSDTESCSFLSEIFGLDSEEYDSDESDEPVHLPEGPSWLHEILDSQRPQGPGNKPPSPGHQEKPPSWTSQGERPSSTDSLDPEDQQEGQEPQEQVPGIPIFGNSKPIPNKPPGKPFPLLPMPVLKPPGSLDPSNASDTAALEKPLIISIPEDQVDDTDGEGVLVGE